MGDIFIDEEKFHEIFMCPHRMDIKLGADLHLIKLTGIVLLKDINEAAYLAGTPENQRPYYMGYTSDDYRRDRLHLSIKLPLTLKTKWLQLENDGGNPTPEHPLLP